MAKLHPDALKQIVIDGEATFVPARATLADVVPAEVSAVHVLDHRTGKLGLVPRERFNMAVPDGFTTHLTPISKG